MTPEEQAALGAPPPVTPPPVADPRIARLEADLAEQRRMTTQLQQNQPKPNNGQPDMEALNRQFYKEPVSTAAAIAHQAANEAIARERQNNTAGQETLIHLAQSQSREKDPELWDKYKDEIATIVTSTVDPQYRVGKSVWDFARDKVFGAHMTEIREEAIKANPNRAPNIRVSDGGPSQPTGHQPQGGKGAADKLSDDEKDMARKMDLSPEQYAKGKEYLEGQANRGKSSWDQAVTFNSKDRRRQLNAKRTAAAAK